MPIINRVAAMQDEIAQWRRDIHENPEILYEVHRTAGVVADKLKAFGCDEVVPGIGKTGVVGVIKGRKGTSGKVIGMRADMDALPMTEMTGLPYASKTPGKMHACGHDGHTAMHLVEDLGVLMDVAAPLGDLVLHGGNAVDDGHEGSLELLGAKRERWETRGNRELAGRQADRPQGVKVH